MAEANFTGDADFPPNLESASLSDISDYLNRYAALLAGVEEIARSHESDSLALSATVTRQINYSLGAIADHLHSIGKASHV